MVDVLGGVPVHSAVEAALRDAAARRGPVDTGALLVALIRADAAGDWSRILLHAGDAAAIAARTGAEPGGAGAYRWRGIELTRSCAIALDVAARLAHRYRLQPVPPGAVALGLIADRGTAAASALGATVQRAELLSLLQSEVLGTTLTGLDDTLETVLGEARAAFPPGRAPAVADGTGSRVRRYAVPLGIAALCLGLAYASGFFPGLPYKDGFLRPGEIVPPTFPSGAFDIPSIPPMPPRLRIDGVYLPGECVRNTRGPIEAAGAALTVVPCTAAEAQATVLGDVLIRSGPDPCPARYPETEVAQPFTDIAGSARLLCLRVRR